MRSLFGCRFSLFVAALFVATASHARAARRAADTSGATPRRPARARQPAAMGVWICATGHAGGTRRARRA